MNQAVLPSAIRNFTDLHAWKEGHKLVLLVYALIKTFPQEERFELRTQICSAAVSITSNVAEGFSRNSFKEKVQFYAIGLGSVTEVQNQLYIARDVGYITDQQFGEAFAQSVTTNKLINGLIKKTKSIIHHS
jgi:four helix bundle protein